jgi:dTDP-4-amino-4,6-dideoxygalactose transaminase
VKFDNNPTEVAWWKTNFGQSEIDLVVQAFQSKNISQGEVTKQLENELSSMLNVPYVVAVSSGSAALAMALMALGVSKGDEVIVPNRTWIATAHAVYLLGAEPVLADVEITRPIIDVNKIEKLISRNTKAIIPVHLNGRSADMGGIKRIARKYNLNVVEDAAQALGSKNSYGYLGTQSDVGCFSLSITKIISTGQGGFVVTGDEELGKKLRAIRTHGVENVTDPKKWGIPGFNFRITDIQASIGLAQISKIAKRIDRVRHIYSMYLEGLDTIMEIKPIPVSLDAGEVPIYNEFLCDDRERLIQELEKARIGVRPFLPNLALAEYLRGDDDLFPNSSRYGLRGVTLPSGPGQSIDSVEYVIDQLKTIFG